MLKGELLYSYLFLFLYQQLNLKFGRQKYFCIKEDVGLQVPEMSATSKTRVLSCEEQA